MGVGVSIVVVAVGAILRFATNVHSSNFNIQTIGDILMIVGIVGFIVSLFFWASWGGFGTGHSYRRRRVYQEPGYGTGVAGRAGYTADGRPLADPGYAAGGQQIVEEERRGY